MAMFSAIEDSYLYYEDWDKIMTLLAGVDADNMLHNINTAHLTNRVLTAVKSDSDTPSLMEVLMGEYGKTLSCHVEENNFSEVQEHLGPDS